MAGAAGSFDEQVEDFIRTIAVPRRLPRYHRAHGPARAAWRSGPAYESLDIDSLVVQSRDDEHNDVGAVERVFTDHPRARLVLVDGLAHRRTARDQVVVDLLADFLTDPA
jgi:hypothetical protein